MHFRDRGKSVQLVRTTYDADTKKPKTEVVGKLARPGFAVDEALKAKLTPEELAEVTAYSTRAAKQGSVETDYAVARFPEMLKLVADWYESADEADATAFTDAVQRPLSKLRRAMAKSAEQDTAALAERKAKRGERKAKKAAATS